MYVISKSVLKVFGLSQFIEIRLIQNASLHEIFSELNQIFLKK